MNPEEDSFSHLIRSLPNFANIGFPDVAKIGSITPLQFAVLSNYLKNINRIAENPYLSEAHFQNETEGDDDLVELLIDYYLDCIIDGSIATIHFPPRKTVLSTHHNVDFDSEEEDEDGNEFYDDDEEDDEDDFYYDDQDEDGDQFYADEDEDENNIF